MKPIATCLTALLLCGCATRGFPPEHQIVNFDRADADLYRGGQPTRAGVQWLASIGVKSVVNLRMAGDTLRGEQVECLAQGIVYTNIPLSGISAPTKAQMEHVLAAIAALPKPVFVHCEHGCDRTGCAVACWKVRGKEATNGQALDEADKYGMSPLEVGMRSFVRRFK